MSKLISTLEHLHRMRTRVVEDLSLKLATQKQLCQRFENNIAALHSLTNELPGLTDTTAAMMFNQASYKRNIQRVIDWQKQEQALADIEARTIQSNLLSEAKREKCLERVLDDKRDAHQRHLNRQEQKMTDAVSTQCWLRQQIHRSR
jgi:flagellar export protein FliJ